MSITLNSDQLAALDAIQQNQVTFLSGEAGTGKSATINSYLDTLSEPELKGVAVTATTGVAAQLLGGSTIHAYTGTGTHLGNPHDDMASFLSLPYRRAKDAMRSTHTLFVDEVSMLSAAGITNLDQLLRHTRQDPAPFGGLNVVFIGDFMQIPPINGAFAFEAPMWEEAPVKTTTLTQCVRADNPEYAGFLSRLRLDQLTTDDRRLLARCGKRTPGKHAVQLAGKRAIVEDINDRELAALSSPLVSYVAQDSGDPDQLTDSKVGVPTVVNLKVGAQVMHRFNDRALGLVNGSMGVVTKATRAGSEVDFGNGPIGIKAHDFDVCGSNIERVYCEQLDSPGDNNFYRGANGRIYHESDVRKDDYGSAFVYAAEILATRKQMPLTLAWALTLHKCQGATLDAATIHTGGWIPDNGLYVAMSRVRNEDDISILGSFPRVNTNRVALRYCRKLSEQR